MGALQKRPLNADHIHQANSNSMSGNRGKICNHDYEITAYVTFLQDVWNHKKNAHDYKCFIAFDAVGRPMVCDIQMISDTGEILTINWYPDGIPGVG